MTESLTLEWRRLLGETTKEFTTGRGRYGEYWVGDEYGHEIAMFTTKGDADWYLAKQRAPEALAVIEAGKPVAREHRSGALHKGLDKCECTFCEALRAAGEIA